MHYSTQKTNPLKLNQFNRKKSVNSILTNFVFEIYMEDENQNKNLRYRKFFFWFLL